VTQSPDSQVSAARRLFAANVKRREDRIDLGLAALLIAKEEYPRIVLEDYLERLDILAAGLAVEIDLEAPPQSVVETISTFLGQGQGFDGDREDYYDPRNSYLSEVMDRRLGLPVTLSLLYMEVARRVGVHLLPVPMPGHFLVKLKHDAGEVYLDPFNRGTVLNLEACRRLFETSTGDQTSFDASMLAAGTKRQMIVRLLRNLKGLYVGTQDLDRALRTVELLLAVTPWDLDEIRDRGLIFLALGRFGEAQSDLQAFVEHAPPGEGRNAVEATLRRMTSA
jgi:regulator of sirC expression with transglutaminase-like and TPR domain